jgi:3,4-dihydroxy 2-butanone 4-phosphate synthase/GTP cyclohydrolase II
VRVHVASFLSDMLGQAGPRKRILQRAMAQIGAASSGVILIIAPLLNGNVHQMLEGVFEGMDERTYGIGAQILADLKIHDMILLTNTPGKSLVGLEAFGLSIVEERAIENGARLG